MGLDLTRSLNGGATCPLTPAARAVLLRLAEAPVPRQRVNPGVVDRLTREPDPLAEVVGLPSPFVIHRGADIRHLRITEAGRAEVLHHTLLRPAHRTDCDCPECVRGRP